jgi:glycosyltransferase involved in cell wall biosynthesis
MHALNQGSAASIPIVAPFQNGGWPAASLPEHVALGKFTRGISMLAWAYNEEDLIEGFLRRAIALLDRTATDWEIVLVDDCSTDRTNAIATALALNEPRIRIVRHERNLNVGMACRTAIAHATKEFLFWQTVDWSYDIDKLRVFLELLMHFDAVQGSRPVPIRLLSYIPLLRSIYRVRRRSDSFYKAIISLGNYYLLTILFGARFHDFQNVSFYRTSVIQSIPLVGRTSFVSPELLVKSYYNGARFIEVPIRFTSRQIGIAKGTRPIVVIRSVLDIARNWISWGARLRFNRSPRQPIWRVSEPFRLDQAILRMILPLFDDFK